MDLAAELKKVEEGRGAEWTPKTRLGRLVRSGEITSMSQALGSGLRLREPEIVDVLLPGIGDEVTSVNMVQRMTDSGRRVRFSIQAVVGNRDGFVGIGMATGKEVGPTIRKAIDNAKLNVIEIRRGCGSWECGCGTPHTVPFRVIGQAGSAEMTFKPAPRGVGLAVGDIAKKVLSLAGVKDAWGFARGQTRTTVNAAQAAFDAMRRTVMTRISEQQAARVKITSGASVPIASVQSAAPPGGAA
ncbi:MAG TPA: 30S ribosomal protein S5 [Candidatus Thermoplasmatota archaeon]|nr:30S ribosomal protein S5 [Candidatus Thermoplasmatota archaeon]